MTGNRATSEIDSALMRLWHMNKTTATTTEAAWVLNSSCDAMGLPWYNVVYASTDGRCWVRLARCHRGPLAPTHSGLISHKRQSQIKVSLTAWGSSSLEVELVPHLLFIVSDFLFYPRFSFLLCSFLPVCRWYIRMHLNKSLVCQCHHCT